MINNLQYNEAYLQSLRHSKDKIDKLLVEKQEDGTLCEEERLKLEQERFLAPLFDMTFGYNERFKSPW